jgi:hypothetical protein
MVTQMSGNPIRSGEDAYSGLAKNRKESGFTIGAGRLRFGND